MSNSSPAFSRAAACSCRKSIENDFKSLVFTQSQSLSQKLSQNLLPAQRTATLLRRALYRSATIGWAICRLAARDANAAHRRGLGDLDSDGLALKLAWIGLVGVLPTILLTLVVGHVADRFDRKAIVSVTSLVLSVAAVGLATCRIIRDRSWPFMAACWRVGLRDGFSGREHERSCR